MSSKTAIVAAQFRLQEWAAQIKDCQNRPSGMSVIDWCACNGITKGIIIIDSAVSGSLP